MGSVPSAYLNKTKVRSENKQTRVDGRRWTWRKLRNQATIQNGELQGDSHPGKT